MTKSKKTCFVIMPITTPKDDLARYGGDKDHFKHVLEFLFTPALESLGYVVIPPKASGSDIIQAEIIKNLETADLVFCDMSSLNANVFFELGIRTALDRPVCMVKDDGPEKIPFDTSIINAETYGSALNAWELEDEGKKLQNHIKASQSRSSGKNSLWKYFGLTQRAEPAAEPDGIEAKIDAISLRLEALQKTTLIKQDPYDCENWIDEQIGILGVIIRGEHLRWSNDDESVEIDMKIRSASEDALIHVNRMATLLPDMKITLQLFDEGMEELRRVVKFPQIHAHLKFIAKKMKIAAQRSHEEGNAKNLENR